KFNGYSQFVTQAADKAAPGQESDAIEQAKNALREETRKNFRAFLEALGEDQPFCYWWGPTNVHRKWIKGSGKRLWGIEPDDLKGKMPPFLPDVHEVREDLADYFGEIAAWDDGIGIILEELEASGEA